MQDQEEVVPSSSSLLALPIVVPHPAFSSSPKVLCAAACVCKDWRLAVQQCAGCSTDVSLELESSRSSSNMHTNAFAAAAAPRQVLRKVAFFSCWLATHRPLIRNLQLTLHLWMTKFGPNVDDEGAAAVELLRVGMQQAAATCCVHPVTATEPSNAMSTAAAVSLARCAAPQQQQLGLRLSSFSSDAAWSVGLLPLLPAHSLTCLEFNSGFAYTWHGAASYAAAAAAALPRLSSLQQLVLRGNPTWVTQREPGVDSCLAVLGQLRGLTSLEVSLDFLCSGTREHAAAANSALQQLLAQPPPQLQELHLGPRGPRGLNRVPKPPLLDMSCLRQLQQLVCRSTALGLSVLPAQLQRLELPYCWSSKQLAPVMQLQQLTALSLKLDFYAGREDLLKSGFYMRKPLRRLKRLPALQELRLAMEWTSAIETASAWAQLPQLCDLEVRNNGLQDFAGRAPRQRLAAVVAQIGATTALTKLVLDVPGQGFFGLDEQQAAADVCAGIIGLTRLKHLELGLLHPSARHDGRAPAVVAGYVCMLTELTGLTHLALPHGHGSVGDDRAAKLACCLKQLCHLNLDACCIGSMVCLGAIADLQQLTALHLDSNPGVTQQGLMLLTRLSRLQRLDVCRNAEVTDAAVQQFWSALHGGGGV